MIIRLVPHARHTSLAESLSILNHVASPYMVSEVRQCFWEPQMSKDGVGLIDDKFSNIATLMSDSGNAQHALLFRGQINQPITKPSSFLETLQISVNMITGSYIYTSSIGRWHH